MLLSAIFGSSLGLFLFSTLVVGDPGTVITINSVKVTNNPNDYFDPWDLDVGKGKKNSVLNAKLPTKKELPDTMQLKLYAVLDGGDPIEYVTSVCDALTDETIGKSFVDAGIPKDSFPKDCPFGAGDWSISKWDPPTDAIPPGMPDGPISGYVEFFEEGKDPCVKVDFEGELSHPVPGMGR